MSLSQIKVNNQNVTRVDEEPTYYSENLVKSDGVYEYLFNITKTELLSNFKKEIQDAVLYPGGIMPGMGTLSLPEPSTQNYGIKALWVKAGTALSVSYNNAYIIKTYCLVGFTTNMINGATFFRIGDIFDEN